MEDILILVDEQDQEIGHMGKMEAHVENVRFVKRLRMAHP